MLLVGGEVARSVCIEMGADITGAGIMALAGSGLSVQHLILRWDPLAATGCVRASEISELGSLPQLESVLFESSIDEDLTPAIAAIAQCHTLSKLSVVECLADAEDCLAAISACDSLRHLEWRAFATDVAVYELVRGGSALEHISLSAYGETGLTDDAVFALAQRCPHLVSLSLSSEDGITDAVLVLLESLPKLRRLDVRRCALLTAPAIHALSQRRPCLRVLSTHMKPLGCPQHADAYCSDE